VREMRCMCTGLSKFFWGDLKMSPYLAKKIENSWNSVQDYLNFTFFKEFFLHQVFFEEEEVAVMETIRPKVYRIFSLGFLKLVSIFLKLHSMCVFVWFFLPWLIFSLNFFFLCGVIFFLLVKTSFLNDIWSAFHRSSGSNIVKKYFHV